MIILMTELETRSSLRRVSGNSERSSPKECAQLQGMKQTVENKSSSKGAEESSSFTQTWDFWWAGGVNLAEPKSRSRVSGKCYSLPAFSSVANWNLLYLTRRA